MGGRPTQPDGKSRMPGAPGFASASWTLTWVCRMSEATLSIKPDTGFQSPQSGQNYSRARERSEQRKAKHEPREGTKSNAPCVSPLAVCTQSSPPYELQGTPDCLLPSEPCTLLRIPTF